MVERVGASMTVFRRQLVVNPLLPWNTLEPGLLAATVLGQRSSTGGTYCAHCRESDHSSQQCALASLQQQLTSTTPGSALQVATRTRSSARTPRRLETALNLCMNWNRGLCERVNCIYRHVVLLVSGSIEPGIVPVPQLIHCRRPTLFLRCQKFHHSLHQALTRVNCLFSVVLVIGRFARVLFIV